MKIREVFEYVDEIMENVFSEKMKLRWLNQIEAELQTDVLLLAADGIVQYTLEDMDAELIAPPPYDELYTEYLQYRICLAQEEPERANNKAVTYNRIYTEYQIYIAQTANPGNGMAERMRYYLTAYQIAVKCGYCGSELEWLSSLHGRNGIDGKDGKDGTGVTVEFNEETGMLEITVAEAAESEDVGNESGAGAVGIVSVQQTRVATDDGGINEWTMTLTNGKTAVLQVRNGSGGSKGDPGNNGIGVSAIGYNEDTGKWYWTDNSIFNRTPFSGPDIYSKAVIDQKLEELRALIGAGNDQTVCGHSRTEEIVTFLGSDGVNGTHRRRVLCKDCGATLSDTTEACSPTRFDNYHYEEGATAHSYQSFCSVCDGLVGTDEWGEHIDEDGDGICDLCESCAHDYQPTYTALGNGKHTKKVCCTRCGWLKNEGTYSCQDRNGDGLCDDCGATLGDACGHEHTDTTVKSNQDGTHTVTTTCTACGERLSEETVNCQSVAVQEVEQNGNGTHSVCERCAVCGYLIRTTTTDCKDLNGDLKCDVCGATVACPHTNTTTAYSSKGDQTHIVTKTCTKCDEVVEQYTENCANANGDGLCDLCGGEMCQHGQVRFEYMSYADVTHRRYAICAICGKTLRSEVVPCVDGNGDGSCDLCGGSMACSHSGRSNIVYTDKQNGTHMYTATCSNCGEELEELQPHSDNGNGVCSRCGAAIPSNYESGTLNGCYQYLFDVKDGALICTKPAGTTSRVAVGKMGGDGTAVQTSGQKVLPIPIPKGARSFTYWAPNDYATKVTAIFFKGVPSAVESSEACEDAFEGFVDHPTWTMSFAPDTWDFVVLNVGQNSPSAIYAQRLGTQGRVSFSKG